MNKKFKFLRKNTSLLDLGSSPGVWSQVASREIRTGKILAVDIQPMEKINNVDFVNGDFRKEEIHSKIKSSFYYVFHSTNSHKTHKFVHDHFVC